MNGTGVAPQRRRWQVWAAVLAVLAVLVVSAAWAANRPQGAFVLSNGAHVTSAEVVHSRSPKPVVPTPRAISETPCPSPSPAPDASTEATTCGWWHSLAATNSSCAPATPNVRGSVQLCGSYWFSNGGQSSALPSTVWSAIESAMESSAAAPAPPVPIARPSAAPEPPARDPVVRRLAAWDDDDAHCVVLFKGVSGDEAVRRLGGDPAKRVPASVDGERGADWALAGVGVRHGWTVVSGWNYYACADPETLAGWSRHGVEVVATYWNTDIGAESFGHAVNGTVLTTWDYFDGTLGGSRPHALDPRIAGLKSDVDYHGNAASMALVASVAGIELPYGWTPDYQVWLPND